MAERLFVVAVALMMAVAIVSAWRELGRLRAKLDQLRARVDILDAPLFSISPPFKPKPGEFSNVGKASNACPLDAANFASFIDELRTHAKDAA